MDCKDEEKMIPVFLQDELDIKVLNQFIEHIDECPECMDVLCFVFVGADGLERLEAGNNFNLQKALTTRLSDARYQIKIRHVLLYTLICLEAAVAAEILIALIIVFKF